MPGTMVLSDELWQTTNIEPRASHDTDVVIYTFLLVVYYSLRRVVIPSRVGK